MCLAISVTKDRHKDNPQVLLDGIGDAERHIFGSAMNAYDCGETLARMYGNAHESESGATQSPVSIAMDLANNEIGYALGMSMRGSGATDEDIWAEVLETVMSGMYVVIDTENEEDQE